MTINLNIYSVNKPPSWREGVLNKLAEIKCVSFTKLKLGHFQPCFLLLRVWVAWRGYNFHLNVQSCVANDNKWTLITWFKKPLVEKKRSDGEMEIISMPQWVIDRFIPDIQAGFYVRRKPNEAWEPQCLLPAVAARLYTRLQDSFSVAGSNYSRVMMQRVAKHIQEWSDQQQVCTIISSEHQTAFMGGFYGRFHHLHLPKVFLAKNWCNQTTRVTAFRSEGKEGSPQTPKHLAAEESLSTVSL